jgi:hypothetical protein
MKVEIPAAGNKDELADMPVLVFRDAASRKGPAARTTRHRTIDARTTPLRK